MANLFELVGEVTVNGVAGAQQKIENTGQAGERLTDKIARAGDSMETFGGRVSSVGDRMSVFSGAVAAAGTAVGGLVGKFASNAAETLEFSKRLNINAQSLQIWERLAGKVGASQDALRDGFKELQLRADEFAKTGKGPAAEAFDRLGLSQSQLDKVKGNTEELFNLVRDRIKDVGDEAAQQRLADELFGGEGGEQLVELLTKSRSEIEKMKAAAREAGGILSDKELEQAREFRNQMKVLKTQLQAAGASIASDLIPHLQKMIPTFKNQVIPALKSAGQAIISIIEAFSSLPGPVQGAIVKMVALSVVLGPVLSIGGRVISMFGRMTGKLRNLPGAAAKAQQSLGRLKGSRGLGGLTRMLGRAIPLVGSFFAGFQIGKLVNSILAQFPRARRAVSNFVGLIAVELPKAIGNAVAAIPGLLSRLPGLVKQFFTQAWQFAKQITVSTFTAMKAAVKKGMAAVKQFIKQPLVSIKQLWKATWDAITQSFRATWNALRQILQSIKQGFTTAWQKVTGVVKGAWTTIKGILNSIRQGFASAFEAIRAQTIGRVESMVNAVTSKVKAMWQALTGNSIIPRMANEAIAEFGKMADSAEKEGERTRQGLEGAVSKAKPGSLQSGGPGAGMLSEDGRGGGDVNIDMSRAVFKDDGDVGDRLKRKGSDLTGAFN